MLALAASCARNRSRSFHTAWASNSASSTCASNARLDSTWPLSVARISVGERPAASPSRIRRPLRPKMSVSAPPSRSPSWSSVLWMRLRARLRSPTSLRR